MDEKEELQVGLRVEGMGSGSRGGVGWVSSRPYGSAGGSEERVRAAQGPHCAACAACGSQRQTYGVQQATSMLHDLYRYRHQVTTMTMLSTGSLTQP